MKKLIIGLGNPGKKYEQTRHNVGFLVIEELALRGVDTELLKPQAFMNESGRAIAQTLRQTNMEPKDIIVIYDDADLPFGDVRMKTSGSSAGHRGMQSVLDALGTQDIARVRVGIGRPENPHLALEDFVLQTWTTVEQERLEEIIKRAADAVESVL